MSQASEAYSDTAHFQYVVRYVPKPRLSFMERTEEAVTQLYVSSEEMGEKLFRRS